MNPLVLGAIGIAALLLFLGRGTQAQSTPDGQTSGSVGTPGLGGAGDVTVVPPGVKGGSSSPDGSSGFSGSSGSSTQDSIVSTYTAEPTGQASATFVPGPGFVPGSAASNAPTGGPWAVAVPQTQYVAPQPVSRGGTALA